MGGLSIITNTALAYQAVEGLLLPAALQAEQVHLWLIPIRYVEVNSSYLDKDELARWQRFHFAKDKQRFLVSHTVLRYLLAQYLNVSPAKICYHYSHYQKPSVSNSSLVQFNMSHSAEYVLYGFSQQPLGVDIEKKDTIHDLAALANRFFSPTESNYINQLQGQAVLDIFYKFWTHKEAWLKCQGTGLHQALSSCEIDPRQQTQLIAMRNTIPCHLSVLPAPEGYAAALSSSYQQEVQLVLWNLVSIIML